MFDAIVIVIAIEIEMMIDSNEFCVIVCNTANAELFFFDFRKGE